MPKQNNNLAFIDYCNLMETIERTGEKPTTVVTSHNKDTLTYWEAYQNVKLINNKFNEIQKVISDGRSYDAIIMGDLISLLRYKNIITTEDFNDLLKHTQETFKNSQEKKD